MRQALLFDFDGTILETETPDYQSWQECFSACGCELPKALWATYIGTASGTFDPYALLEQQWGQPVDRAVLRIRRRQRFHELVGLEPLRPGVLSLLEAATQRGIRLAVASRSTRDWVEENLAGRNLRHYFEYVYTANDVAVVKPDPALYLAALAALGVTADQAIALEDSRNGLIAAKRAGLKCVVAPNAMTSHMTFA